jgi:hypothetical protein
MIGLTNLPLSGFSPSALQDFIKNISPVSKLVSEPCQSSLRVAEGACFLQSAMQKESQVARRVPGLLVSFADRGLCCYPSREQLATLAQILKCLGW